MQDVELPANGAEDTYGCRYVHSIYDRQAETFEHFDGAIRLYDLEQMDKLESTHTFARAMFYGQNGQFRYAGKQEQQLADACKRLVQNVIVCWNCFYLNQQLFHAPPAEC